MTILQLENLGKRYGPTWAVRNLSLKIEPGQVYGLLGPNGSGKTSTLSMSLGATRISTGSISWFTSERGRQKTALRHVGSILEQPYLYPHLSAMDNLRYVATLRLTRFDIKEANGLLKQLALEHAADLPFAQFSLGMKQRLGLATAMIGGPQVLVLDEPTNGLDAEGIVLVRETIRSWHAQGKTIILASHILGEVEKICTHLAILKNGQLLQGGAIDQVLRREVLTEVGAVDENRLEKSLQDCPFVRTSVRSKSGFEVKIAESHDAADLNFFLVEAGVRVSHLVCLRTSLEEHFMTLVQGVEK